MQASSTVSNQKEAAGCNTEGMRSTELHVQLGCCSWQFLKTSQAEHEFDSSETEAAREAHVPGMQVSLIVSSNQKEATGGNGEARWSAELLVQPGWRSWQFLSQA